MSENYALLKTINTLEDFKRLPEDKLKELATEMRGFLVETVAKNGGHLASNLGVVELTFALHRVFNVPEDSIIFDVGHQSYVHKILTGRREAFTDLRKENGLSGFPKRAESNCDSFDTGHASTSISAALGMARARALSGNKGCSVALIGDGALSGGLAFEALNDAGQSKLPIIVILNDNEMSIAKNVGALNRSLNDMRSSRRYQKLKRNLVKRLDRLPAGERLFKRLERTKNRIKYFLLPNIVFFESLGFSYLGPIDGHDIDSLVHALKQAREMERPVLLHVITKKGSGYLPAEQNPEKFHGIGPFDPATGETLKTSAKSNSSVFGETLCKLAGQDPRITAITAAMTLGTGLTAFSRQYPDRFFDVGIAEEHAVTMAAGMAAQGLKPVVAIYSSFLQRAYDGILHDVCLQNLPVVFAIDRAGLVGEDGETHQGVFDIAFLSTLPNMTIFSPSTVQELVSMFEYAMNLNVPVAIRYNRGVLPEGESVKNIEEPYEVLCPLGKVNIVATGRLVKQVLPVCRELNVGLINLRTIKPLSQSLLDLLKRGHVCITVEDGILQGGVGQTIAARLSDSDCRVIAKGIPDIPITQGTVTAQDSRCGLLPEQIRETLLHLQEEI